MKNKKPIIVSVLLLSFILLTSGCSSLDKAQKTFDVYVEKWVQADYSGMYEMLTEDIKESLSEEDFVTRYNNIFSAINANDLIVEPDGDRAKEKDGVNIPFKVTMNSIAGNITLTGYKLSLIKENKEYKIKWDEGLIFPQMIKDDKVWVNTVPAKRGSILDKDGNPLAQDGILNTVGIYPAKFNKGDIDAKITEIASTLDISEDNIKTKLNENTNPRTFYSFS